MLTDKFKVHFFMRLNLWNIPEQTQDELDDFNAWLDISTLNQMYVKVYNFLFCYLIDVRDGK